jgi:hypothetical protein
VMGATVAGLGGVEERERWEETEEMGRWWQMNCREVRASKDGNCVMRFMVEVVVEDVRFGSGHEAFYELF